MSDPCTISTALYHQIMVTVNQMDEWIVGADAARLGGHTSPSPPVAVLFQ